MRNEKYLTIENLTACIAIVWGAFVFNPFVCSFSKNPQFYAPMAEITNYEVFWGAVYIIAGVVSLILSAREKQNYSALLLAIVFILLSTLFFLGDFESQGWGVYGTIGIGNAAVYFADKWKARQ